MRTFLVICALALSYCTASTMDYRALVGPREIPLPEPVKAAREPMTREQVEHLVRYAMLAQADTIALGVEPSDKLAAYIQANTALMETKE